MENDTVGEFIDTHCDLGKGLYASGFSLYREFQQFIADSGASTEMSRNLFTKVLKKRLGPSVEAVRTANERGFRGIALKKVSAD